MVEEGKGTAWELDSPVPQEGQGDQGGHVLLEGLEAPGGKIIVRIEKVSELSLRTWPRRLPRAEIQSSCRNTLRPRSCK